MHTLSNKVAIITGASSGIGRAAALLFARAGAALVLGARRAAELDALVEHIEAEGGRAAAVPGDLCDESFAAALVDTAERRFGGLDLAFNNAGTLGALAPAHELSLSDWRATLAVNLDGAFCCARHQIPALLRRGGGSLTFTSSFVGPQVGFANMAAYAAAKAGLSGLVRVLAVELGRQGIRANAILSGGVDTPLGATVANSPEARAHVEGLHALGRIAAPEEIARVALFLASDAASFVTGSMVSADGGVSISRG
ncbi:SDR family oxidoreductase [Pseudenhygromyxa sp. WMMC2535]|uniref:SDR family oxidoreductase n=1 Tax=Pseudenhygromyxa sp. WMMC2535 TaxID=2712867 RepID=UPI001554D42D|nr:SDR family oxidoreductase [Pseudenhygromyxa sp. WMMC2535]NVB39438.1 SDR family oxidoreductase [Pseudenhygromyxa sp. WMMC2535]